MPKITDIKEKFNRKIQVDKTEETADNMFLKHLLIFAIAIAEISHTAEGTDVVMSHVSAHFGKTLEECREEVKSILNLFNVNSPVFANLIYINLFKKLLILIIFSIVPNILSLC